MTAKDVDLLELEARKGGDMAKIEFANGLIEHPVGSAECSRGLTILRDTAEGSCGAAAQWLLGIFYLQTTSVQGAHAEAARWLSRAAESGVAPAIDRLANLHLRGLGVAESRSSALRLLQILADLGFQQATWDIGYLLSQDSTSDTAIEAATAFSRACALGFPPAYYSLGLRFATGEGVQRDPDFARALLMRANDAGFPDALAAADEFAPELECGIEFKQWYEQLKANLASAQPLLQQLMQDGLTLDFSLKPMVLRVEAHFAGMNHPQLLLDTESRLVVKPGTGHSAHSLEERWKKISDAPKVEVGENFSSREECAHLIYNAAQGLMDSKQYTADSVNGLTESTQFTGRGRPMGALTSDCVVRTIEQRIALHAKTTVDKIELCSIIAYGPGEEYHPHVDFFNADQLERNRRDLKDISGQRVATFLICLQAPELGGETMYNSTGLQVRYKTGMAALHHNVTPDGMPDKHSLHQGQPVKKGQKWLMRTTLREHSLYRI